MSSIENYSIDIVKRTEEILNEFYPNFEDNDREVTFLMNCLLGLILTAFENSKKGENAFQGNIDQELLELLPDKIGFLRLNEIDMDLIQEGSDSIHLQIYHKSELQNSMGKSKLLRLIRNAIAHQNIEGINEDGYWVGIRIWNINNSIKDFEAIFAIDELKKLALYIARQYITFTETS